MCNIEYKAGGHKLVFSYNPTVNLFFHTLNLYGLLGNHGRAYRLRNDENAIKTVIPEIYEQVKDGDYFFSYGKNSVYCSGMECILKNGLWKKYPDFTHFTITAETKCFVPAYQACWDGFYQNYWAEHSEKNGEQFKKDVEKFDWQDMLEKMQLSSQQKLFTDIYAFSSEAAAGSGMTYSDNVTVGSGGDMAVVHEGLHLLLREKWADDWRIKKLLEAKPFDCGKMPYSSYIKYYEQALVLTLEHIILGRENKLEDSFRSCEVHDLYGIAYPAVKDYYESGCKASLEDVMLGIILAAGV